jgi:hypothetical protein
MAKIEYLLALTATITPGTHVEIVRSDPAIRRADYLRAFRFWLAHPDPRLKRILLMENSGADMSAFHALAQASAKQVEILSQPQQAPPAGLHYGYSELVLLDAALERSTLRRETTHMAKATGRLVFPDLPRLLNRMPAAYELAVDARRNLPFRRSANGSIPTQLFLSSHAFYDKHLRKSYLDLRPDYPFYIENLFYDRIMALPRSPGVMLRWPVNCEPRGFAAHAAKRYDSAHRLLITGFRSALRVMAPDWWF